MALFLIEFATADVGREGMRPWLDALADRVARSGGTLVEAQVAADLGRTYVIAEHDSQGTLAEALKDTRPPAADVAEVRLVGATLADVKAARGTANYLVEWDLPVGLTMDRYLSRKKEKSPLYAQVPEVKFLRTYVREDMAKCLCFYDAPDKDAVKRAREVVQAPIDRLTRVEGGG
jgi:hypothetical protein